MEHSRDGKGAPAKAALGRSCSPRGSSSAASPQGSAPRPAAGTFYVHFTQLQTYFKSSDSCRPRSKRGFGFIRNRCAGFSLCQAWAGCEAELAAGPGREQGCGRTRAKGMVGHPLLPGSASTEPAASADGARDRLSFQEPLATASCPARHLGFNHALKTGGKIHPGAKHRHSVKIK